MSAVEAQKVADVPVTDAAAPAVAPVVEPAPVADKDVTPAAEAPKAEEIKPETDAAAAAPVEEKKEEKVEAKPAEPIYSGALGYKAPGLKNAFRFSKKYFWFGEEPVPTANLREYLRGEKPEVAHPVGAWSNVTGKGLLYFVKHADQKEHPAGVLNLAYATDLHKDGALAFALKISGHKHAFEASTATERDGWYVAIEKGIADAKEAKEGIESSEAYKEHKEKIGKPTTLAAATASAPKKSTDATPKAAETETPAAATEETAAPAPARTGSASSSSSDEDKKAKKAKSKSRSASRKRASIFGGLLGKKDKAEEKKDEPKVEGESSKAAEAKKDEAATAAPVAETTTAPVITSDVPAVGEETKTDATPAPIVVPTTEESKAADGTTKTADEKPKPAKRGSIFGTFFEKVKSPTTEKKEAETVPAAPAKDAEPATEASKPLDEAVVAAPATTEATTEPAALKTDEVKPETKPAVSTPSKEKEHFSFGKLFGSKDRAKSPAATDKAPAPEASKVDAVAPKIEDPIAPAATEATEPVAAPTTETKVESPAEKKEETTPVKKEKRGSIFGTLGRTLSKATKSKDTKEKKEAAAPTTVPETAEPKEETAAVVAEDKEETPAAAAPAEKSIGDVVPEAVTVGEAPKSSSAVPTTA